MSGKRNITQETVASFLEGNDPQERIVNLEYSYKDNFIKVFYRDEDDNKCSKTEPFYPFLWAKKSACLKLCGGNKQMVKLLLQKYNIGVKALDTTDNDGNSVPEMEDGYTFMFFARQPMSYSDFLDFFKEAKNPVYSDKKNETPVAKKDDRQFLSVTPQEQFLISTGKRFFKGYDDYDQTLRMIFDLETTGLDTKKDRIEQFGIRFNRPVKYNGKEYVFEKIYSTEGETEEEKNASELKNIDTFLKIIYTFKPDIITAHNGEAFDWNMIIGACERLGTTLEDISKKYFEGNGIIKNQKETILKLGGEIETFHQTIVPHTIITDSLHAVRRAQALDSNMLFSNLKYVTKYSKIVKENRVYIPGAKISDVWNDETKHYAFNEEDGDWYIYDPNFNSDESTVTKKGKDNDTFTLYTKNRLLEGYTLVSGRYIGQRYLLDDLWECDKVEHRYNIPNFLICKMLPVPFQKCCTMGTAGQWKSLLMAWSYENGLAIPSFGERKSFTGGLSRLLRVGFVDNVAKFDYNSLYPSIILTWNIRDKEDITNVMTSFLEHVLTQREKYKKLKKSAAKKVSKIREEINEKGNSPELTHELLKWSEEESANDKKQLPLKILGNSFFGSYAAPNVFPWASIDCAERTTCTGRQSLRLMIYWFNKLGYTPIVGDTDGFNFQLPKNEQYRYTEEHPYISPGLSRETEKGKSYTGFKADVAEFNDLFMSDKHYDKDAINKMGLGIDEVVNSTINFSRKNYSDYFPEEKFPNDVKMVGNTIKSKKMPEYISKFLEKGIRYLLRGKGQEFIEEYYAYIDKIYNYQIPLKQIASKGKVKKSIAEYVEDCKTITKAGRPKSRQAWMELLLLNNVNANMGETVYYINTGNSKSQADVKKVTHYYKSDGFFNEKTDIKNVLEKEWKKDGTDGKLAPENKRLSFNDYVKKHHSDVTIEDEIILNCKLVPQNIIDSETDILCEEGEEYNVPKYIDQFNKRITPLLVCFAPEIRNTILVTKPDDRKYFTKEECELCSGYPNKIGDQDTYEQLMTMEDKEIKFWKEHPQWKIPFLEECEMDWNKIVSDYDSRKQREKDLGIENVREKYNKFLENITPEMFSKIEDGELPAELEKIVDVDPQTNNFVSKEYPDIIIGTIYDIFDAMNYRLSLDEEN